MDIVNLISSIGFPAVMCFLMWKLIQQVFEESSTRQREEIDKLSEVISNNTQCINEMISEVKSWRGQNDAERD